MIGSNNEGEAWTKDCLNSTKRRGREDSVEPWIVQDH